MSDSYILTIITLWGGPLVRDSNPGRAIQRDSNHTTQINILPHSIMLLVLVFKNIYSIRDLYK